MANRHKIKEKQYKVGDSVTVRIPRIDRTCTDFPRIPCIIVAVHGKVQKAYRLRYIYNHNYTAELIETT